MTGTGDPKMKVLAINSSLRRDKESRTELMLSHLILGMREAGAEVEVVNLRDKDIEYCTGCFSCDTVTPGQCALKDDMSRELYPKWLASDMCIYASPLFHGTFNAPMKAFIDRTWPSMQPFFTRSSEGQWVHPSRHEVPKAVVLSAAEFSEDWISEDWIFDSLSSYAKFLWGRIGKLAAEIYRPGAMSMGMDAKKMADILDATESAGRELVGVGFVFPETLERIGQPITDPDTAVQLANMFWQTCIDEGLTPEAFNQQARMPRPHSLEDYLTLMAVGITMKSRSLGASAAESVPRAAVQFEFTGEVVGECYLILDGEAVQKDVGKVSEPDATIRAPFELWMDIVTGKASPVQMFMEGRFKVEGNLSLLMKMWQLFGLS